MYITLVNRHELLELTKNLVLEAELAGPYFRPKYVFVKCSPRPFIWGWVSAPNTVTGRGENCKQRQKKRQK